MINKSHIIKFIRNEGGEAFQASVINWIKASDRNFDYYNTVKAEYISKFEIEEQIDIDVEYKIFVKKTRRDDNYFILKKVAAVIVVLLLLGSGWYLGNKTGLLKESALYHEALPDSQKRIVLEDGSIVYLNSGSELEIDFKPGSREVKLNGEAFFEVVKDVNNPFIVHTESGIQIKVLGTSFNVKSYSSEEFVETTLVSGIVEVYEKNKIRPTLTLRPKQKAILNKNDNQLTMKQVVTTDVTSWMKGVLIFDNEPISIVLESLERWYDVDFIINDQDIHEYTFSGKILREDSLEEILELLKASSPISYKYENKKIIINSKCN